MSTIKLNSQQQAAVDHIYGPLLVLAGPGTGKTQLLSSRIAAILEKTDVHAQNILCLTFTESAAFNMRERLSSLIGDASYDVHIATYHGFGSDIIRNHPEAFASIDLQTGEDSRLERPIDELTQVEIVNDIIAGLPYDNPLYGSRHYIGHVVSTISELKRSLITPEGLRTIGNQNLKDYQELSPKINNILGGMSRMPSGADKAMQLFQPIVKILNADSDLATIAKSQLDKALDEATEQNSSKPLTAWKNAWLKKDADNTYTFTERDLHLRMIELSKVYEKYQIELQKSHLYDFDDMILKSIDALRGDSELKYTLQEKYQFILLDEFQDTNAAQFELVKLLSDNPIHENKPNVFAVGDDDQAIYAFQGAEVSNMLQFTTAYDDVAIVNLEENYRSHQDILQTAESVSEQLDYRLHREFDRIDKKLIAKSPIDSSAIERVQLDSQSNEYAWVSDKIASLIDSGVAASEIAVLAPKHRLLEGLVPFLHEQTIPVTYEKREDILSTQLVSFLETVTRFCIAAQNKDQRLLDELLSVILSFEYYDIAVSEIWKINWDRTSDASWTERALHNEATKAHAEGLLAIALKSSHEPLEYIMDYIIGTSSIDLADGRTYASPLRNYYFDDADDDLRYFELITHLSTIREHLRARQSSSKELLTIHDFIGFIQAYQTAEQPLLDTHPVSQAEDSVQLMTVYKSKGLEFRHVFLLSMHNDLWGPQARSNANKLSLPANLKHIRYAGSTEDELKRLFYVAITRSKQGLYLTSHSHKDTGKPTQPLKFLQESDGASAILPEQANKVEEVSFTTREHAENIETLWSDRHIQLDAELKQLLKPRLQKYQMSPTHLNTFIDTEYGGPDVFLLNTLLRFPAAPTPDGEFGNAVHETLDFLQKNPTKVTKWEDEFTSSLSKKYIPTNRRPDYEKRGIDSLTAYLKARPKLLNTDIRSEVDFRMEGVVVQGAHLSGKIDRIEIDTENKTIDIVDFKTGKPHSKWDTSIKLKKYKQQLYFYKLLIEGSNTYANYTVNSARLEFTEPDKSGQIAQPLYVDFKPEELKATKQLIKEVWNRIQNLDL